MKSYLIYIFLIILVIFRYVLSQPVYKNGDRIRITGTVYSDPIDYDTSQYLRLAGLKVYLPLYPEIYYGDKVIVEGLVDDGVLKDAKLISQKETVNFTSGVRKKIIDFYETSLSDPYSGLLAGVTLGSKGSLTNTFWEKVKKVGVAHVVVASGTNISFVTSFLIAFLSAFLERKKMIPLVILGVALYLFISGFEAPLIRAAIMASIVFIAQESGRLITAWKALVITALVMLIIFPNWLVDLGFILSFVATASLILFEKRIRDKLTFIPEFLKESLSTSLAAQIGVTPILFVTFGNFNIWSPIINMLVLWTIPIIMVVGAIGGIIGLFMPLLGQIVLYIGYPVLWWFNFIVEIFT